MFRRRPRPAPVPPPAPPLEVVVEAIVPIERSGKVAPAPPRPFTSWHDAVTALLEQGYRPLDCPGMCRRKGDHAHLRHEAAATDITVYPAVVERGGA